MALFGRREIQRRIDAVAEVTTTAQLNGLVRRLNLSTRDALRAEWELVWLAALKGVGNVRFEPKLPGSTRIPDVHYFDSHVEFIADVTAVSDEGFDEQNPVDELRTALDRLKAKHGLNEGGFRLKFASRIEQVGDRKVPRVILPPRKQIRTFVKMHFDRFLGSVAKEPKVRRSCEVTVLDTDTIQLEYDPELRPHSQEGGHLCYDLPASLSENPVYRGLKEKRRQLNSCNFSGIKGVILCDGDCAALGRYPGLRATYGCTLDQIVGEFFRQHRSIAFVVTAGVRTTIRRTTGRGSLPTDIRVYFAPHVPDLEQQQIFRVFDRANAKMPNALWSPEHALTILKKASPPPAFSIFAGWDRSRISISMEKTTISLPARTVVALLTGEVTAAEYQEKFRTSEASPARILAECEQRGMALKSVQLESGSPDDDGDMVKFVFEDYDAGKAQFRVPPYATQNPATTE